MVGADSDAEPADAAGHCTVVFVHGFLDDSATWDEVVANLKTPDLDTVRLDLAGMAGRPDAPGPYTVTRYADQVTSALDTTGGRWSWSGRAWVGRSSN
jgi:alpha-beta hydrolase superfamily lysophospholipase